MFIKEALLKLKSHIKLHTLIVGDFNIPLSSLDWNTRQKINKETKDLIQIMAQLALTDIYRTFHPNIKQYTFFSVPHGTSSKIYHILGNIANLNRYKIKITPSILSDHHALKLVFNSNTNC
ncbi:Retrovirus-related Pol polyprotein LINE-1 [Cricetulus griseus]|uniref:Retrovirus-related Pol polyprotein LINE-1 n=1 Tax=Cricetulus griseus TaxID=10029 RepID=G3H713_CRIGR|nr:Retrovirus-related Pol polyprotein LINE-1 [Cricetulus griseus]